MVRLPWLFRNRFGSLEHSFDSSRKQILSDHLGIIYYYHENVSCVYSLESPHRGDSNEYTQHTMIL